MTDDVHVTCNVCGSGRSRRLFTTNDFLLDTARDVSVVQCLECGLQYVNPQPRQKERLAYYPDEYPLYDVAFGRRPFRIAAYDERRRRIERHTRPGRILDVGCMDGGLLKNLEQHGWEVYGFDTKPEAVTFARDELGLPNITVGELQEIQYPPAHFDAVNIWGVLEDLENPRESLKDVYRLMKPGAWLIVATHNIDSWEARHFGPLWFNLEIPRHLYHFSPKTLFRLLAETGFAVRGIQHFTPLYVLQMSVRNRQGYGRAGVADRLIGGPLSRPYCWLSTKIGQGTMIEVYATRRD